MTHQGEGNAMEEISFLQAQHAALEEKKYQLELEKLRQGKIDIWTKFVGTLLIAGVITGAIQWYGIREERAAKERAERAQNSQTLVQLANAREAAVANLRIQMFSTLLQHYFRQGNAHERIAILEMIGLNFRDAVQIKPMFKILDAELRGDNNSQHARALKQALRMSAKSIIKDQLDQIRQTVDGSVCRVFLTVGKAEKPHCFPGLEIELRVVEEDKIQVRANTSIMSDSVQPKDEFWVTYFDMPMVDYTVARSGSNDPRNYSIVLSEAAPEEQRAEIVVAVLPYESYPPTDRYNFDRHFARFLDPVDGEREASESWSSWPVPTR
jgi:hypothetical protein